MKAKVFLFLLSLLIVTECAAADQSIVGSVSRFDRGEAFTSRGCSLPAGRYTLAIAGKFHSKPCDDLLLREKNTESLLLVENTCAGFLKPRPIAVELSATSDAATGDVNFDGCDDLAVLTEGTLSIYFSNCGGGFLKSAEVFQGPAGRWRLSIGSLETRELRGVIGTAGNAKNVWFIALSPKGHPWYGLMRNLFEFPFAATLADVDGDESSELLFYWPEAGEFVALPFRAASMTEDQSRWRAAFPGRFRFQQRAVGDFNGDRKMDLLVQGDGVAGWWVAMSNGRTGIERPVRMPGIQGLHDRPQFVSGDFHGGGVSSVIIVSGNENLPCQELSLDRGAAIEGVTISLASKHGEGGDGAGSEVKSSSDGSFELRLPDGEAFSLSAKLPGFRFLPAEVSYPPEVAGRRPVKFLAFPESQPGGELGERYGLLEPAAGPSVCTGYHPYVAASAPKWGADAFRCQPQEAWFAVDDRFPARRRAGRMFFQGSCCPLPAADLLEEETIETEWKCPDGWVAVGSKVFQCPECIERLLCARVNGRRYQLSDPLPGVTYGAGVSHLGSERRFAVSDIPAAIRGGVARLGSENWDNDGCIGFPFGALYTGNSGRGRCDSHIFREVRYRGLPGDPPAGTPVKMFPDCSQPEDVFDPVRGCRP